MRACTCLLLWATSLTMGGAPPESQPATQPNGPRIEGIVVNHLGAGVPKAVVQIRPDGAQADAHALAEAHTDGTGDFVVRLPPGTTYPLQIRITRDGYKSHTDTVDEPEDGETPFIDVTMEGSARLTGTVVTRGERKPVADAFVRCENGGREWDTRTDAEGTFVIEDVVHGSATLVVNAEGFALERRTVAVTSDDAEETIEIRPARVVELQIVTDKGDPADKVLVEAIVEPMQHFLTAVSDASGKATLRGVGTDAAAVQLRLNGDRYVRVSEFSDSLPLTGSQPAESETPAEPFRETLTVRVAATVRGTVTDAKTGQPIVGVRVVAGRELRSNMPMIWTSLDGAYELRGLAPGTNVLSWQHDDYATVIQERELEESEVTAIDLKMSAGLPIAGKVVDEGGKPLDGVWVTAEDWKGYSTLGMRVITGEDGTFRFPNAPEGEIKFSFVHGGHEPIRDHAMTGGKTDYSVTLAPRSGPAEAPQMADRLKVGDAVPDLTLTCTDGTVYKLSALRGKFVFLDFWASWCGPCIAEVPHMKALAEAMKNTPSFVMIGVSLDEKEDLFRKAVEKHGMNWAQACGPRSGASESFESLEGFSIPYTCLVGPDGRLLAQRLRGPGVVEEVRKHMKWFEEPAGHDLQKRTTRPSPVEAEPGEPSDDDSKPRRKPLPGSLRREAA